jgi:hypothetical protein
MRVADRIVAADGLTVVPDVIEERDAPLIAATPELLEALEKAKVVIDYAAERLWNGRPDAIRDRPADIDAALRAVSAAIAKARGAA